MQTKRYRARLKPNTRLTIFKGEDRKLFIQITDENTSDPVNLGEVTEILFSMKQVSGLLIKKLSDESELKIENNDLGIFSVALSEQDTSFLRESEVSSAEILVEEDEETTILMIEKMLEVKARLS